MEYTVPGSDHETVARRAQPCVLALTAAASGDGVTTPAGSHHGRTSRGAVEVPVTVSADFTSLTGPFRAEFTVPGRVRMVPAMANGQPAFAAYLHDEDGVYRAHAVMVLSSTPAGIARIVIFLDPGLFGLFGLPQERGGDVAGPAPQDLAVPPWPR